MAIYNDEKINKFDILKFFLYFVLVCFTTFAFLYLFGLVPDSFKSNISKYPQEKTEEEKIGIVPSRIVIPKIGADSLIYNPENNDIKTLNKYLGFGAVRYPSSGLIGKGNILIFGHSADIFLNVTNPAFKTFNNISKLERGDIIELYSKDDIFLYRVKSVRSEEASEALIKFDNTEDKLTISTCNTFGQKEDRYIVEATFIGEKTPVIKPSF